MNVPAGAEELLVDRANVEPSGVIRLYPVRDREQLTDCSIKFGEPPIFLVSWARSLSLRIRFRPIASQSKNVRSLAFAAGLAIEGGFQLPDRRVRRMSENAQGHQRNPVAAVALRLEQSVGVHLHVFDTEGTGQVTRKKPFQLARGAIEILQNAYRTWIQDDLAALVPTINGAYSANGGAARRAH